MDDVYGLIDGVKLGLGRAVLPKHLIKDEKDFKILRPEVILKIPMYLLFYKQPHYSKLHALVVNELKLYFQQHFNPQK